jgi:hypothetical protein
VGFGEFENKISDLFCDIGWKDDHMRSDKRMHDFSDFEKHALHSHFLNDETKTHISS